MFQKLKLKSMLRNCDYVLAGTVLKQQYYDESKPTELNRLIDNLLQRPGFETAVELIKYNELFIYYFTESCKGGLYVRKQAKSDAAENASDGSPDTAGAAGGAMPRTAEEAAAALETPVSEEPASSHNTAPQAAQDDPYADTRVTYRRKQLEKLEHAWNELLDEQLQRISHKQKSVHGSDPAAKAVKPVADSHTTAASARDAYRETEAEVSEHLREVADDSASVTRKRSEVREESDAEPADTRPIVFGEDTARRLAETKPSLYSQAELQASEKGGTVAYGTENAPPAESGTDRFGRAETAEPEPHAALEAPSAQPEVFVETMPFRNPYASLFPDADDIETMTEERVRQTSVREADKAAAPSASDRTPEAAKESVTAEPDAWDAEEEPEDADLAAIQPQFTKFPNVIATLKIDIKEMRKQIGICRRRIEEHPEEREKYEQWIVQLEEAVEEFMLSAAILSQYK